MTQKRLIKEKSEQTYFKNLIKNLTCENNPQNIYINLL